MYTTLKRVTDKAIRLNFTVGAFNMHNLEMLPAMIRAAKDMGSPIIIQTSVGTAEYIGYGVIVNVCKHLAEYESTEVVLHLDHCNNFADIRKAIDAGYSSVMYDGSSLCFKENVLRTQEVVEYAHTRDVSVEGELGAIGGIEDGVVVQESKKAYTNPEDAKRFVFETGVDALAVAVGTNHGQYKSKTELNIPLLKEIHKTVDIPLVIHGGTGVKDEDIQQCIRYGVRKFNVGTELLVGWTREAAKLFSQSKDNTSLRKNIVPCNEVVADVIKHKIGIFLNA
ncbi:fructose-bisphosphate aldolase class II [Sporomusaceae bacterium BoRhaA]|uniref:class II fructose-bisphosphate aldolase n=1 Tax=Pelorhabdus rhamnosifermentans TaxID=2772457 RepID=UPI001C0642AF|nr:class II fructose-bisphosphate aldolase [Pelorhabdus rhamnosifermentans]MBU2701293.1 fructose-bisphosphate aldolase class II [Pelorhabdus rhamnosifermentans]